MTALCSIQDIKTALAISESTFDAELGIVAERVTKTIEHACGVTFMAPDVDITEYKDVVASQRYIWTDCRPVNSVTTLHEDTAREYGAATLVDADDYVIYSAGRIYKANGYWTPGAKVIKLVYDGGYHGITDVPLDLRQAACWACVWEWNLRRNGDGRFGLTGKSYNTGDAEFTPELPIEVVQVLNRYRRGSRVL